MTSEDVLEARAHVHNLVSWIGGFFSWLGGQAHDFAANFIKKEGA